MEKSELVLCTLEYPYGSKETFLETEIIYLAKEFDIVYLLPSKYSDEIARPLPSNVLLITDLCEINSSYHVFKLFPFLLITINVFFFSFKYSHQSKAYITHFKSLLHHLYNDIQKMFFLKKIIETHKLQKALFYDYWLLNDTISLIELKKKGYIKKIVARTHRFDLYDEALSEGVVPFKQYKVKWLDKLFTISKHGETYLKKQVVDSYKMKIHNSYLGVPPVSSQPVKNDAPLIISCSSMIGFKQVPKIAEAISQLKTSCTWIHFGDGVEYDKVEAITKFFPSHVSVQLNGFLSNVELLKFYEQNYVNCFISLSSSEGLPVSMMEVQSFGIPIIAPAINGIPELVNETTGVLLPENYSIELVTTEIEAILNGERKFDQDQIIKFFKKNFNSDTNYTNFATCLKNLWAS